MALDVLTKDSLIRAVGGSPHAREDGTTLYNVLNQVTAATPSTAPAFANGITLTTGGLTVTAGGLTVTAGGLTVSASGITVTGNSTITGTLGGLTGLTVVSGGATITAGDLTMTAGDVILADAQDLSLGTGVDALMRWSTGDADNHVVVLALGDDSQALHITDKGAVATDWNVSANTHPNVYVHSNTTPATDYLRIGDHDGTEADIDCVGGTSIALKLAGTEYASLRVTGLAVGTYVQAATAGTDQLTLRSTGTAPASTGANVGHLYADFETDDDELFWLSGTVGTATQLTT